jgi:hypothetical protein
LYFDTTDSLLAKYCKNALIIHIADVLCQHLIDLGRTDNFAGFWSACLSKIPLSQAMLFCHVAGVNIP